MDYKLLAAQLRKPDGQFGRTVAENMNKSNNTINLHTIQLLQLSPDDAVLEIGMGNGFFCKDILSSHETVTYTGCDFSELMIDEASSINKEWVAAGRARFVEADITQLPFEDNSFHKLLTVNTIYFWEDTLKPLTEIFRVLKPGGVAVISLRTKESMLKMPFVQYGFSLFEENELLSTLKQVAFSDISISHVPDPPFNIGEQVIQLESLYAVCRK